MINNNYLISKFTKEVEELEKIIKYREFYNIRNFFMSCLIKSGIVFEEALPFIIIGIFVAYLNSSSGKTPFKFDDSMESVYVETIDTSSGVHIKHFSSDISYDDELIEYSTGWIINDNGLYERTVTSYRVDNEIDLSDVDSILSMTREELENILIITNVKTIRKNVIDPDDEIYMNDAIIVVNHYDYIERNVGIKESEIKNISETILYIIQSLCWGYACKKGCSLIIKTSFSDKLKRYKLKYKIITEDELENLYKILEVKKKNLDMINGFDKKDNIYCKLRKR